MDNEFTTAVYIGHCLINKDARDAMVRVIGTHGCRALLDACDAALHKKRRVYDSRVSESVNALIRELAFAEAHLLK